MTDADEGILRGHHFLICDRDTKWSAAFRQTLADVGIRVLQTPYRAPNCNAHAERFVRSITEECLDRLVFLGEAHRRQALAAFVAHYHRERNHQGIQDRLIAPEPMGPPSADSPMSRPPRRTITVLPPRGLTARPSFRIVRPDARWR